MVPFINNNMKMRMKMKIEMNLKTSITPSVVYPNAEIYKFIIYSQNKNKSGIYR